MHLFIVHYHWRPGGVRRVVETALAALASDPHLPLESVTLASGEPPPADWAQALENTVTRRVSLDWVTHPLLAYASEWPGGPGDHRTALTEAATRLLEKRPPPRTVLLENPAVGRHPLIGRALADACATTGSRLLCHHHDTFVDGRWERWPEWQACGIRSLDEALAHAIPDGPHITHLAVTARDTAWMGRFRPTHFCPNPVDVHAHPTDSERAQARAWLAAATRTQGPVWLCPTRLLRRKNLAESILLARLLAPQTIVATTGGISSPSEARYAAALADVPGPGGRALHAGLLATAESTRRPAPAMAALMAACDRVVVTSLFEGYGLPVVEASAAGALGLARREACPDARAPHGVTAYDEVLVPWAMAGGIAERARQEMAWRRWHALLPPTVVAALAAPPWWHDKDRVPFSRLTLRGQLETLQTCAHPDARNALLKLNPALLDPGQSGAAAPEPAPPFPPVTLAECLVGAVPHSSRVTPPGSPTLLGARLPWANHYPLLWPGGDNAHLHP